MRVPGIAWWPGTVPAGVTTQELACNMDLFTTAVKLAGGKVPADRTIDGLDLTPVLTGKGKSPRDTMFYYRGTKLFAVRHGPWKGPLTPPAACGPGKPGGPRPAAAVPPRPRPRREDGRGEGSPEGAGEGQSGRGGPPEGAEARGAAVGQTAARRQEVAAPAHSFFFLAGPPGFENDPAGQVFRTRARSSFTASAYVGSAARFFHSCGSARWSYSSTPFLPLSHSVYRHRSVRTEWPGKLPRQTWVNAGRSHFAPGLSRSGLRLAP